MSHGIIGGIGAALSNSLRDRLGDPVGAGAQLYAFGCGTGRGDQGEMVRLLPDSRSRSILLASGLGAALPSYSYAAVALV